MLKQIWILRHKQYDRLASARNDVLILLILRIVRLEIEVLGDRVKYLVKQCLQHLRFACIVLINHDLGFVGVALSAIVVFQTIKLQPVLVTGDPNEFWEHWLLR